MKILVTGGAGFIGSHLIERLLEDGHQVASVDSMNDYYDVRLKRARLERFKDRVVHYEMPVEDHDALAGVFAAEQPDAVCHLAAQAGVRYSLENPYVYGTSNVDGTLSVLEEAKRAGVKRVLIASSSSVYGETGAVPFREDDRADEPISIYAATKRADELLARTYHHLYGMEIACLRFFTVYGPYGRPDMALFSFSRKMLAGEPIDVFNNGEMKRDFTYVSDIVDGITAALSAPLSFEIVNLGYGSPVALMDFIRTLEKELDVPAKLNFLPMQAGDVPITYADTSKAKALLGFSPKVGIEEGVKRFVAWYRAYYQNAA